MSAAASPPSAVRVAPLARVPTATLYRLLALRSAVFVVEQVCAYLDADGADLEPGTLLLWVEEQGVPVATARVLRREGGDVIGRIVTAPGHRGRRLGALLLRVGMHLARPPARLGAQSRLRAWYETHGFAVCGPEYVEDGIPHLPMRAR